MSHLSLCQSPDSELGQSVFLTTAWGPHSGIRDWKKWKLLKKKKKRFSITHNLGRYLTSVLSYLWEQRWRILVNHLPESVWCWLWGSVIWKSQWPVPLGNLQWDFQPLLELCPGLTNFYEVWWCELFLEGPYDWKPVYITGSLRVSWIHY